jgi:hypothetical protein
MIEIPFTLDVAPWLWCQQHGMHTTADSYARSLALPTPVDIHAIFNTRRLTDAEAAAVRALDGDDGDAGIITLSYEDHDTDFAWRSLE